MSIFLKTVDGLYVLGSNNFGQLGLGDTRHRYTFQKLEFFDDYEIISIVHFSDHTAINTNNGLYVFGENLYGDLGLGHTEPINIPTKLQLFNEYEVISIALGNSHTIIHTTNGLYVHGSNRYGQLGLGDNLHQKLPIKLDFFEKHDILSISCGYNYSIINTTDGVYVFGYNNFGQLGLGDNVNRKVPTKLDFFNDHEIKSIICGANHTMVNTNNGLYVFGINNLGQLGLGRDYALENQCLPIKLNLNQCVEIMEVFCGYNHSVINTTDGLYVFGDNYYGQLGLDNIKFQCSPTELEFFQRNTALALGEDHEIISIFCGSNHTIINTVNGLYVFGHLNMGNDLDIKVPTKLDFNHEIITPKIKKIKSAQLFV